LNVNRFTAEKLIAFRGFLSTLYRDSIVCLNETWLSESRGDCGNLFGDSHHIFRLDRPNRLGGGSCIFVPADITCAPSCPPIWNANFECISLDISPTKSHSFRLVLVYRPPDSRNPQPLIETLTKLSDSCQSLLLFGDLNLPHVDWENSRLNLGASLSERALFDFFVSTGLEQHVLSATHRAGNCLDVVFSSEENLLSQVSVIDPPIKTDHSMIHSVTGFFGPPPGQSQTIPNFRKADYLAMERDLCNVEWEGLFAECTSVHDCWDKFKSIIDTLVTAHVPDKKVGGVSSSVKHDKATRNLIRKQANLHSRLKKRPDLRKKWQEANSKAQAAMRLSERRQEAVKLEGLTDKDFWGLVRDRLTCKSKMPALYDKNGTLCADDESKSDALKDQFASVFISDNNVPLGLPPASREESLNQIRFTPEEVYEGLTNLPNKVSAGPDGIPQLLLKKLAVHLAAPLCHIFNISLATGQLPKDWLLANITAIFKKGLHSDPANYRPISLTSAVCKLFERLIRDQMLNYFLQRNIISQAQHGFMANRSTVTQLLKCCNEWTKSLDTSDPIDVVYLDISKAFDQVSHEKLLEKLAHYGIGGELLAWIKAYLANRQIRVRVNSVYSEYVTVTSSVPQGSVIGTLLFLIFINDLPEVVQDSSVALFADDSKLYFSAKKQEDRQKLKDDLERVFQWANRHQLSLALHKCEVLHLGARNNPRDAYSINGIELGSPDCIRDLGVIMSSDMRFSEHCSKIASTALTKVNMIFKSFQSRHIPFLVTLFKTFVLPQIEYACQVWSPNILRDVDILESVQRTFTRRLPGLAALDYPGRLIAVGLEPLELRRIRADLVFVYKIIHGLVDLNFEDFFDYSPTIGRCRGHPLKLQVPPAKSVCRKQYFACRVVPVWNALSTETVTSRTLHGFKSKVKNENLYRFLRARF